MRSLLAFLCFSVTGASAFGAYAPIPNVEKGQTLVADISSGILYDSNIFGDASGEQDSLVFTAAPVLRLNSSLTSRTFINVLYQMEVQHFEDRPGDDTLFNHVLQGQFAHRFSERASIRILDVASIIDNPEAALNLGLPGQRVFQQDQSYFSNRLDVLFNYSISERLHLHPGAGIYGINYRHDPLARLLDLVEWRANLATGYSLSSTTDLVGEVRYKSVTYDTNDVLKGSDTLYYLVGLDYDLEEVTTVTARLGLESRDRNSGGDVDRFYGEAAIRHGFLPNSFVSLGIEYAVRETQANLLFMDKSGPTFTGMIQYDPTGAGQLYFNGSISMSHWKLNARPGTGVASVEENEWTAGLAAIWTYDDRWSVILSYDLDLTASDLLYRDQERHRVGLSVRYTFGVTRITP